MKCEKLDLMCFKSILTKMLSLVKSIVHKMLRLPRSGSGNPTARPCEEDQRYLVSSPVMGSFEGFGLP